MKAIFFDFDGVIADTERLHYECWTQMLEPLGIRLTWEYYAANCIGVSDRAMLATLAPLADPPADMERLEHVYARKRAMFREAAVAAPPVHRDTQVLLEELNGFKKALVTSSCRSEVQPILEAAGIFRYFDVVVYGDDVTRLKPEPDPYLLAQERLGVWGGVALEDSNAGIASAQAAGLEVVQIHSAADVAPQLRLRLSSFTNG